MKIVSWNVNGLRSGNIIMKTKYSHKIKTISEMEHGTNINKLITDYKPDIICLQETKCSEDIYSKIENDIYPYKYWCCSMKEGVRSASRYSGVSIWSKYPGQKIISEELNELNIEGRICMINFNNFILINVYVPNSGTNVEYRNNIWEPTIHKILSRNIGNSDKQIIYCGDLNVIPTDNDIWDKKIYKKAIKPGCLIMERDHLNVLFELGYIDIFRAIYPIKTEYSWWSMRTNAREVNKGWRLDYFLIHKNIMKKEVISNIQYLSNIMGSDHCPLLLDIKI